MNDKMMKMMMAKKKGKPEMLDIEKDAKMSVVDAMKKMAQEAMSGKLKGLKKVTVASDSPEGLKEGLEKAEDMVAGQEESSEMSEDESEDEGVDEYSDSFDKALASKSEEPEMSEDELDKKLQELMDLKEKLKSKKS